MCWWWIIISWNLIRVFNVSWNTLLQKKSAKKKRIRAVAQRHALLNCNYQITATNRPRKQKCQPLKSAICMWQMCIISEVILLSVWSYINANNEKYQFNCRCSSINYCHQRYFAMGRIKVNVLKNMFCRV